MVVYYTQHVEAVCAYIYMDVKLELTIRPPSNNQYLRPAEGERWTDATLYQCLYPGLGVARLQ